MVRSRHWQITAAAFLSFFCFAGANECKAQDSKEGKVNACRNVARAGAFAGYVEHVCGFKEKVHDGLKSFFVELDCPSTLKADDIRLTVASKLMELEPEEKSIGLARFCSSKRSYYVEMLQRLPAKN